MDIISGESVSIALFFVGLYGLITRREILKSIISIGIMEAGVVLFMLSIGYLNEATPPIGQSLQNVSDPLPQALVITAIIIGVAVTAINLTMCISLCRQYGTADWVKAAQKRLE